MTESRNAPLKPKSGWSGRHSCSNLRLFILHEETKDCCAAGNVVPCRLSNAYSRTKNEKLPDYTCLNRVVLFSIERCENGLPDLIESYPIRALHQIRIRLISLDLPPELFLQGCFVHDLTLVGPHGF